MAAYTWNVLPSGAWTVPTNWINTGEPSNTPGYPISTTAPGANDVATITNGPTVTGNGQAAELNVTGNLDLEGTFAFGAVAIASRPAPTLQTFYIGNGAGNSSSVTLTGGGEVSSISDYVGVGASGGSGTLNIEGTSLDIAYEISGLTLLVGDLNDSTGTVNVVGPNSVFVAYPASFGVNGGFGNLNVLNGGVFDAQSLGVGLTGGSGNISVDGAGSKLTVTYGSSLGDAAGSTPAGNGLLDVTDGGEASFGSAVTLNGLSSLSLDLTSEIEIGGSANFLAGTIVVQGLVTGSGFLEGPVQNNGGITASGGALVITGPVTGNGNEETLGNSELIFDAPVGSGQTITMSDFPGTGTLELNDFSDFAGTIDFMSPGDKIVIPDLQIGVNNTIDYAAISIVNGLKTLQIGIGSSTNPNPTLLTTAKNITLQNGSAQVPSGYFFNISQTGANTVLTLTEGNPVALAVNAPVAITPLTNITVGIISNSFDAIGGIAAVQSDQLSGLLPAATNILNLAYLSGSDDEGREMAQVVHDIAPQATIDFEPYATPNSSASAVDQMASAIASLVAAGCNVIIDDILPPGDTTNGPVSQAIENAYTAGVTYITAAGQTVNYSGTVKNTATIPPGHELDPDALAVTAMNVLATPYGVAPNTAGNYLTPQTELFAYQAPSLSTPKQFITGPDGMGSLINLGANRGGVLFGTSFAAPAVGAVAALLMEEYPALKNQPTLVDQILLNSATGFSDNSLSPASYSYLSEGKGLVNAGAASALALATLYPPLPCFAAGTRILALEGEIAVESLQVGDKVQTHFSGLVSVQWIGYRRLSCRRHPDPESVWPVRIKAGAFGNGLPRRDLLLSPNHAVFLNDVLIPIRYLINESTIMQTPVDEVSYYHIELPNHDLLISEGMLVESYLDAGDRSNFANGDSIKIYPNFSVQHASLLWEVHGCAPLVVTGSLLDAAYHEINVVASTMSEEVTVAA